MKVTKTLGQFIIEKQADFPYAKGELSRVAARYWYSRQTG